MPSLTFPGSLLLFRLSRGKGVRGLGVILFSFSFFNCLSFSLCTMEKFILVIIDGFRYLMTPEELEDFLSNQ